MFETGSRNAEFGAGRSGFRDLEARPLESRRAAALRACVAAPRSAHRRARAARRRHRRPHRPQPEGQVRRPRRQHRGRSSGGTTTMRCRSSISTLLLADFLAHAKGKTLFAQDLYGGADPGLARQGARLHRIRLAFAVHPQSPDPSAGRGPRRLRPRSDDRRPAVVPRRPEAPRRAQRDGHRLRLHPQDRADRRHELCRRDEEVGLHLSQLRPAGASTSCRCIARPTPARTATRRSSSASPAPARRRSRPIRIAR